AARSMPAPSERVARNQRRRMRVKSEFMAPSIRSGAMLRRHWLGTILRCAECTESTHQIRAAHQPNKKSAGGKVFPRSSGSPPVVAGVLWVASHVATALPRSKDNRWTDIQDDEATAGFHRTAEP